MRFRAFITDPAAVTRGRTSKGSRCPKPTASKPKPATTRPRKNSWAHFCPLFLAKDHFAVAHELIVQPQLVFVGGCFAAGPRRAAEQADAGGPLKNVRRKGTAVHIKFDPQIAGVGDPRDLVAVVEHDR